VRNVDGLPALLKNAAVLTLLLLMVLVVVGGAAAAGGLLFAAEKRRRLAAGATPRALPAGPGDRLLERTLRDLRVGDVLTLDSRDFLVEGTIAYDEDGHRWTAGRIVDGSEVRWLLVGLERVGPARVRLLRHDEANAVSGFPPEALVIDEVRYVLDRRGTATCTLAGDLGAMTAMKDPRPASHVERCRWWLYNAAGDDTLVLEQWGDDLRMLRGTRVAAETIDLIPGS
jgi:hypothetical protein